MARVFIGVGHGGSDSGAVAYGLSEKTLALITSLACKDVLTANGVQVGLSRSCDEEDTILQEVAECNSFNPDIAIEIHYNAGRGDGAEIYYHYKGGEGLKVAQKVETKLIQAGQNSRGLKTKLGNNGRDYYMWIRETYKPAILIEVGFVDNPTDNTLFNTEEKQRKLGQAIGYGILDYFGISYRENNNTPKINTNDKLYRVQVGAFKDKRNAEKLLNDVKSKGYSAYITQDKLYHVQVGAFKNKDNAERLTNELKSKGYSVYIK